VPVPRTIAPMNKQPINALRQMNAPLNGPLNAPRVGTVPSASSPTRTPTIPIRPRSPTR